MNSIAQYKDAKYDIVTDIYNKRPYTLPDAPLRLLLFGGLWLIADPTLREAISGKRRRQ